VSEDPSVFIFRVEEYATCGKIVRNGRLGLVLEAK
jgi:hypothetical protein